MTAAVFLQIQDHRWPHCTSGGSLAQGIPALGYAPRHEHRTERFEPVQQNNCHIVDIGRLDTGLVGNGLAQIPLKTPVLHGCVARGNNRPSRYRHGTDTADGGRPASQRTIVFTMTACAAQNPTITNAIGQDIFSVPVLRCVGAFRCVDFRRSPGRVQSAMLSDARAIPKSLSEARVKITNGLRTRHGPCSVRSPATRCTSSPAIRSAVARPTSRRTLTSAADRQNIFSANYSRADRASRSGSHSWRDAPRRGGATCSVPLASVSTSSRSQSANRSGE